MLDILKIVRDILQPYNLTPVVIDDVARNAYSITVHSKFQIKSFLLKYEDLVSLQPHELQSLIHGKLEPILNNNLPDKFKIVVTEGLQTYNYLDKITNQLIDYNTGGNMKYSDMLAAQLKAALEKEQAIEEKYGVDQTDGSVITFKVKFNMGDVRTYKYAALRIKGLWYLTGRMVDGITWDNLCAWFEGKHKVSKIKIIKKGKSA